MPTDAESATPGLGTSIVRALANQLHARVQVVDGHPGTTVSIIHSPTNVIDLDDPAGWAV